MSEIKMDFLLESPKVKKYELLLSYHPEYTNQVKKFAEKLKQQTTWRVFLCSSDSNDTDEKVLDALRHSRNVVLFMSTAFHSSHRCITILEWSRHFNNCISFLELSKGDLSTMLNETLMEQLDGQILRVYEDERNEFKQELFCRRQQISRFMVQLDKKLIVSNQEFELKLQVKHDLRAIPKKMFGEDAFLGFMNESGQRDGFGLCIFGDKSVYRGHWHNDKRNGYGRFQNKANGIYEGHWLDNAKHGFGTEKNKYGVYKGEFRNNLRNGFGFFNSEDDDVYGGEWKDGKYHGRGVFWYQINTEVYDGQWHQGKRHGKGVFLNKNKEIYDGYWIDDEMHGDGTLTYPNGDKFVGTWTEGKMHGNGAIEFKNGNKVEVVYKFGKKIKTVNFQINKDAPKPVEGEFKFENGASYKGSLLSGLPHGVGTVDYTNGYTYFGTWRNGKMHGTGSMKLEDGSFAMGEFKDDFLEKFTGFMKPSRMCNTKFCMNLQLFFDWNKAKPMTIRYRERLIHDADVTHLHELFNKLKPNDFDCHRLFE